LIDDQRVSKNLSIKNLEGAQISKLPLMFICFVVIEAGAHNDYHYGSSKMSKYGAEDV
jgi:hypothetical protein